jgi:hypothetical protein
LLLVILTEARVAEACLATLGKRLGDDEVGRQLDLLGEPLRRQLVHLDRHGGAIRPMIEPSAAG